MAEDRLRHIGGSYRIDYDAEADGLWMQIADEIGARLILEEQVLEQVPRALMLSGKRSEAGI